MGQDGKMHTEKFASNSVGDKSRNVLQTDQAYDNSATGIRKRAQERQHGKVGHKLIAEQNAAGAQQLTDLFKGGVNEQGLGEFNQRWGREAAPHLPKPGQMAQLLGQHGKHLPVGSTKSRTSCSPSERFWLYCVMKVHRRSDFTNS